MKVILTADLPNVGDVGQVVDVANGYGRNYLIPRGFAILATPRNERSLAQQQKARLAREAKNKAEAEALADAVASAGTQHRQEDRRRGASLWLCDLHGYR